MAGHASKDFVVKIGNASNTPTTVANINGGDLAITVAELDVSSAGNDDMEYVPGQRSGVFSGGGPWTAADHALFMGILGMPDRVLEVYQIGEGAGNVRMSATGFVTAYNPSVSLGSAVSYSVTIRISGALTTATV